MPEHSFKGEESTQNKGDEVVVNEPVFEQDGDRVSVTINAEQAEAVKKMLAGEKNDDSKKPEWLGDFESPEAMRKSYDELRTKMSKGKEQSEEEKKEVEEKAEDSKVNLDKYVQEFSANSKLTDESYEELKAAGMEREVVDNYIAGRLAGETKAAEDLFEVAGGREEYDTVLEWGKANLTEDQKAAYDGLLNAGNYDAAKLVFRGFVQQYIEAEGGDPATVNAAAQSTGTGQAQPFGNKSEMIAAINDRRYKNGDRAYIAEVEKRILASRF